MTLYGVLAVSFRVSFSPCVPLAGNVEPSAINTSYQYDTSANQPINISTKSYQPKHINQAIQSNLSINQPTNQSPNQIIQTTSQSTNEPINQPNQSQQLRLPGLSPSSAYLVNMDATALMFGPLVPLRPNLQNGTVQVPVTPMAPNTHTRNKTGASLQQCNVLDYTVVSASALNAEERNTTPTVYLPCK